MASQLPSTQPRIFRAYLLGMDMNDRLLRDALPSYDDVLSDIKRRQYTEFDAGPNSHKSQLMHFSRTAASPRP